MGWVLDLDGVVWLGEEPIQGAAEAVARLRAAGEELAFVTNNSYAPRTDIEAKLARHGIEAAPGEVITSAAAAATLIGPGEAVLVCAGPGVTEEVEARGASVVAEGPADVVVVGLDPRFDYEGMRRAALAVRDGARLLATNDDSTYPTPEGLLPGGGAILASIERATGCRATVAGKPHPPMCALVRERLGDAGTVVGDRPETDGAFARALGYRFALALSGVTGPGDAVGDPPPDLVGAGLASLVELICSQATAGGGQGG